MKILASPQGRWAARATAAVLGAATLMLVKVQVAGAATRFGDDPLGQTPPALSWIELKDSRGISVWNYELSLDRGDGVILSPGKFLWSYLTDVAWGSYRMLCTVALWFIDWVMGLTWMHLIADPLIAIGDAMQGAVAKVGVVPTFLTISALMAGVWMLRGKVATAAWELGLACVIAVLGAGVFAHPVQVVAGQDGYIVKANQLGQEIATELATGDSKAKTPEQLRAAQTGLLVDTFIRQPTELINFGRVVDGTKCEGAYNEVLTGGPYGTESDIRDAVNECDETLGEYAANPSMGMASGAFVFWPAAFVVLFMGLLVAGSVLTASAWAMFQALKAIVTLVTGLLPGGGRGSLMLTVAEIAVSLLVVVFTNVFLCGFLLVIQELFSGSSGDPIGKTFVIVDAVLVVGLLIYWRQRKHLTGMSERMAQWMSTRPGTTAGSLPARSGHGSFGGTAAKTAALGIGMAHARARMLDARKPQPLPPVNNTTIFAAGGPGGRGGSDPGPYMRADRVPPTGGGPAPRGGKSPKGQLGGPPDNPQLPPGRPGTPKAPKSGAGAGPRPGQTGRKVTGVLVRAGTHAALAYATGGTSTVIAGSAKAAQAVRTARRAELTARLAAAKTTQTLNGPPVRGRRPARGAAGMVVPGEVVRNRAPDPAPRTDPPKAATGQVSATGAAGPPSRPPTAPRSAPQPPSRPAMATPTASTTQAATSRAQLKTRLAVPTPQSASPAAAEAAARLKARLAERERLTGIERARNRPPTTGSG